jgi:hypothetical protein
VAAPVGVSPSHSPVITGAREELLALLRDVLDRLTARR